MAGQQKLDPHAHDRREAQELTDEDVARQTDHQAAQTEKGKELKAEIDDLLDEIDEVLEENAEEFVRSYVQKGGQ